MRRIRRVLPGMSRSDRLVLLLGYADRLTDVEAAAVLGQKTARVAKRRKRALARLRKQLLGKTC